MSKFAYGIADDFVSSTFIAIPSKIPKIICPAMNTIMYKSIQYQHNEGLVFSLDNTYIIPPVNGKLACGDIGIGKLSKPRKIVEEIHDILNPLTKWEWPFKSDIKLIGTSNDSYSYMHIDITNEVEIPIHPHVGAFGIKRRYDKHRGVDLYVPDGTQVFAVEDGEVMDIRHWTGVKANCDWWFDTESVAIEGVSGLVVYGEIIPDKKIHIGMKIVAGDLIGCVKRVLKKDKGRPTSMLHLELRKPGFFRNIDKNWDENLPNGIKDPTPYLKKLLK